jgi:hypothetical protein
MRQQTFMMVSPYMKEGTGYNKFKNGWQFGWETINIPEFKPLTIEQVEAIKQQHSKYLKPKK